MKKGLFLLLLILANSSHSQTIDVLVKGDTILKPKYQQFIYLCDSTDISTAVFVAKIKATGSLKNATNLFYFIRNKAQEIGANGFRFESFEKTDDQTGALILSVYNCPDELFDANMDYLPKNKIYLFGDENMLDQKTQNYKIQGQKQKIDNGHFKSFDIKIGEEYNITKGGFTGMTFYIKRKENGFSSYLSFSGIGVNGAGYIPNGGIGININTGKINHVESNLALALLKIYSEQK
jgi:hypothetical protein